MIPKIIHYCWLSNDPYPENLKRYMATWKKHLPDYEFKLWNFDRFPKDKSAWVAEAFENKKYAFAADYIRNYALYNEGGIYMDMDVEVLKPFDVLLHLPYFWCLENGSGYIDAGIMASEPGNPIFGEMLRYYDSRHFVKADGTCDTTTLPMLLSQSIEALGLTIQPVKGIADFKPEGNKVAVLPYDFFSPIHNVNCKMMRSPRTMAIHHFAGSWTPWYKKIGRKTKKVIGPTLTNLLMSLMGRK